MRNLFSFVLTMLLVNAPLAMAVEPVDMGNTVCPVSGDKVSGKHFVMHQGKKIALCCAHCEKEFKKNPTKFIAELEAGKEHAGHSH